MQLILVKLWRPHTTSPQNVAEEGKSPYFREIQVGEILFHLARSILSLQSKVNAWCQEAPLTASKVHRVGQTWEDISHFPIIASRCGGFM